MVASVSAWLIVLLVWLVGIPVLMVGLGELRYRTRRRRARARGGYIVGRIGPEGRERLP